MPQKPLDFIQVDSALREPRSERMAQVMEPEVFNLRVRNSDAKIELNLAYYLVFDEPTGRGTEYTIRGKKPKTPRHEPKHQGQVGTPK